VFVEGFKDVGPIILRKN